MFNILADIWYYLDFCLCWHLFFSLLHLKVLLFSSAPSNLPFFFLRDFHSIIKEIIQQKRWVDLKWDSRPALPNLLLLLLRRIVLIVDLFFIVCEVCHSSALIREVYRNGSWDLKSVAWFWESRHLNCLAQLLSVSGGGCLGANVTISVTVPIVVLVVFVATAIATAVAIVVTDH